MLKPPIKELFIHSEDTIRFALERINYGGLGIALVVDNYQHLIGTVTDGDVRRSILDGIDLNKTVDILLKRKAKTLYSKPVTAPLGTSTDVLIELMHKYVLTLIPIIDEKKRVIDIITMDELLPSDSSPLQAVIMAGGYGSRLHPFTKKLPKPMLPVGGRPVMEVILEKLRVAGIHEINITTHYLPEKIEEYFGDGKDFGVEIKYVNEKEPLGTGGALGILSKPKAPILVVNGDVLTQVNYRSMLSFHNEYHADMTVAVRQYEFEIPYGVLDCDGVKIKSLREKPHIEYLINAGIYLLNPSVYDFIPRGDQFNMTDLIQWLIDANQNVVSFPVSEYWLDIGQLKDYKKAKNDFKSGLIGN